MSRWPHTIVMIIPAALLAVGNAIGRALDPDIGGEHTFSVPLSADGTEPVTHYGASTAAAESFVQTVQAVTTEQVGLVELVAADYAARWPGLAPPSAEECAAFLAQTVILADTTWSDALDQAGVQMLSPGQGLES